MSGFSEFTLNDTASVIREKSNRFKVEDGKSYRLSLVWWDDQANFADDAPRFIKAARYYKEGVGYVIHDNDKDQEFRDLMKDRPRDVFATIICVWETDDGILDNKAFVKGKGYKVMPWIMSQDKLSTLLRAHKSFGLGDVDISITCPKGGGQYQKMEIMPIAKSFKGVGHGNLFRYALEQTKDDTVSEMAAKIQKVVSGEEANIRDSLGRQFTVAELKEKLGIVMASDTTGNVADEGDLDSIIPY